MMKKVDLPGWNLVKENIIFTQIVLKKVAECGVLHS